MVEAGCPRRFEHEAVVGAQLVEPQTLPWGRKEASQTLDGGGDVFLRAVIGEIGASAFGLRPQPRHRIMDAAVGEHCVDRHAAQCIETSGIGECNEL